MTTRHTRVLLLRHGQVANHRGDVDLTELGVAQATNAGSWFAETNIEVAAVLSGETIRARDTAKYFVEAFRVGGGQVDDAEVSFALRNPDLYLGGHRINMGEGAEALAAQSPSIEPSAVGDIEWYRDLMTAPDRVGFWLEHANPPGDTARSTGERIDTFVRSVAHVPKWQGQTIVAMTHSPVLRAVRFNHWGDFSKEPPFLHGYAMSIGPDGGLNLEQFETGTGDIPATSRPGPGVIRPEKT